MFGRLEFPPTPTMHRLQHTGKLWATLGRNRTARSLPLLSTDRLHKKLDQTLNGT
jgi:hypothetical protein